MDACLICARLFAGRLRFSSSSHALNIEQDLCCRRLRRNGVSLQISCRKEALPIRSFDNKPWREIKKITPIKNLRAYSRFSQYFTYNEGRRQTQTSPSTSMSNVRSIVSAYVAPAAIDGGMAGPGDCLDLDKQVSRSFAAVSAGADRPA